MSREEAAENGREFAIAANCHQREDIWEPEMVIFLFYVFFLRQTPVGIDQ